MVNFHSKRSIAIISAFIFFLIFALPGQAHAKTIFLGDSRTVGMYNTVAGYTSTGVVQDTSTEDMWCAEGGMGYSWFVSTAVPFAQSVKEPGDEIVILMGCNDLGGSRYASYAETVNELAAQWKEENISCYFVSVNPIDTNKAASNGYGVTNSMVEDFNAGIEPLLSEDVVWIDTYSDLQANGYNSFDGVHYAQSTCQAIYDRCKAEAKVGAAERKAAAEAELRRIAEAEAAARAAENLRQDAAKGDVLAYTPNIVKMAMSEIDEIKAAAIQGLSFPEKKPASSTFPTWIIWVVSGIIILSALTVFLVSRRRPKELYVQQRPHLENGRIKRGKRRPRR